ncbi:MAG: Rha family transcriptional regulator [Cloacibacillus sp.]
MFEKEHYNVIRDIEKLEIPKEVAALNFEVGSYKDSQNQERPMYLMTCDGFTGAKATTQELLGLCLLTI